MALTERGFQRRTYDEILNDKITKAIELFGEDIDTGEQTPLGKFIRIGAYDLALAEEELENLYFSIFPATATGVNLDRLCDFSAISRTPARASRYRIALTGTPGTSIPYGFLVETEAKLRFFCLSQAVVPAEGPAYITVECESAGLIGNVAPSEICVITNPVAGLSIDSANNTLVLEGVAEESDVSLRSRFLMAQEGAGCCNEDAIRSAILRVPGVTQAEIAVNETDATDADNRPAHSFECYVSGGAGAEQEIAEAIFEKKPVGIKAVGALTYSVSDKSGITHSVSFSRTQELTIYIRASIRTNNNFASDLGLSEIRTALTDYIAGLEIGAPIFRSALYGYFYDTAGVTEVSSLEISVDNENWNAERIDLQRWQKGIVSAASVTITTEAV